jgi:hypothetical protein
MVLQNVPDGAFHLTVCIGGSAQRRVRLGGLAHLGIPIGIPEALKIERPDMKAFPAESVTPGVVVESIGHRESGGERSAMDVEHNLRGVPNVWLRSKIAKN